MAVLGEVVGVLADLHGAAVAREICLTSVDARVSRIAIPEEQLGSFQQLVQDLGLHVALSDERHVPKPDIGKGGYSNQCYASFDDDHPYIHRLLYVAAAASEADLARRSEAAEDAAVLGAALRYPSCCTAFYESNAALAAEAHQGDLFPLAAGPRGDFAAHSFLLNFAANYFDGGWCSFFPCHLDCDAALARLKRERHLVRQAAPLLAARLDEASSGSIIYTEYDGVAWIKRATLEGRDIVYPESELVVTLAPPLTGLFQALLEGDRIRSIPGHGFSIYAGGSLLWEERRRGSYARLFS